MRFGIKMLYLAGALTVLVEPASSENNWEKINDVRIKSQDDFNHFMTVESWRASALNEMTDPDNKDSFIAEEGYRKSILDVMSKAIADCIQSKNEFQKLWKVHRTKFDSANDKSAYLMRHFVEFDVTPSSLAYERKHWNAFILYNLLNVMLKSEYRAFDTEYDKGKSTIEIVIEKIGEQAIRSYVPLYYTKSELSGVELLISRSVNDIKQYAKALRLDSYLSELAKSKFTKGKFRPPCVLVPLEGEFKASSYKRQGKKTQLYSGKFIVERKDRRVKMEGKEIYFLYNIQNGGEVFRKQISDEEYEKYSNPYYKALDNEVRLKANNKAKVANKPTGSNNNVPNTTQLTTLSMPKTDPKFQNQFPTYADYMKKNSQNNANIAPQPVKNNNIINAPRGNNINNNGSINMMPMKGGSNNPNNLQFQNQNRENVNNVNSVSQNNFQNNQLNMNRVNNQNFVPNNNIGNVNFRANNQNFNAGQNMGMNRGNMNVNNNVRSNQPNMNMGMNNQNNRNFSMPPAQNNMNFNMQQNMGVNPGNNFQGNLNFRPQPNMNNNFVPNNNMSMPQANTNALVPINVQPKLRNMQEIHNLLHGAQDMNGKTYDTTHNKCYFNSTIQCMANIEVLYQAIETSYLTQPKNGSFAAKLISAFYDFFTACRNGSMAYQYPLSPEIAQRYDSAIRNLHSAVLGFAAIYDAKLYVALESEAGRPAQLEEQYKLALSRQKDNKNPAKNHLLLDFYTDWNNEPHYGYDVIILIQEILRPLQDQLEWQRIKAPTKPNYMLHVNVQPKDDNDWIAKSNINDFIHSVLYHERDGHLRIPDGTNELQTFNQNYIQRLSDSKNGVLGTHLPQVLIYTYFGARKSDPKGQLEGIHEMNDMILPEQIQLRDSQGLKTYRLNSFVCMTQPGGGHYLPVMRTKQGWVTINDAQHDLKARLATELYNPTTGKAKCPQVIFYEQIG